MPAAAIKAYARDLPKHRAALAMLLAEAASFPYLDERARRATVDAWENARRGNEGMGAGEKQYALNMETGIFEEIKT